MPKEEYSVDKVRASRAGHTFHERWTARRALQLVFPKDDLHAIAIEGISSHDSAEPGDEAEDVADLVLYYGNGDTFASCETLNTAQFKYKADGQAVTSSYLKKTIQKFAETITGYEKSSSSDEVDKRLSFSFVTNCEFVDHLWEAIRYLQGGEKPTSRDGIGQLKYLERWCKEKSVSPMRLFSRTSFQAATENLAAQNLWLKRALCDWSAGADAQSRMRLFELTELVREKAGLRGQKNNLIKREDVLDALGCDVEDLFPAETRFINVGEVISRAAQAEVSDLLNTSSIPVLLHADGGVGKTVFVQSIALEWAEKYEVVVFDCFGGGAYRSEDQGRHLPKVGLLQIVNELAARGLCDPMLPSDNDTIGIVKATRKRLEQASKTVIEQSQKLGVLVVLDAADNAQIEADYRNQDAFPKLILASLARRPIENVKLLLTARTHRMSEVAGQSVIAQYELPPFDSFETEVFVKDRRKSVSRAELARAKARSGGNARVLDYLVKSWNSEIRDHDGETQIKVEELIASKCNLIISDLHLKGWNDESIARFFAAISLLPPPIPPEELASALDWSAAEIRSAISDLAPMLETISHGAIFRDEPTETYIRETYSQDHTQQQKIADRLFQRQKDSMYAAQALPRFLEVIDDANRAFNLAKSEIYPSEIQTEFGKRRLKLVRLQAAFSLAVKQDDFDLLLQLAMQMAQVASANSRGDEYVRRAPGLAVMLGDHDASRRLLNDRSGWRGARNCRLTLAYCFLGELEEAEIHYGRAVAWINWYFRQRDEDDHYRRSGPSDVDFASVMLFSAVTGRIDVADKNLCNWGERFAQRVANLLVSFAHDFEALTNRSIIPDIERFAASHQCKSLALQIALLVDSQNLNQTGNRSGIGRATGSTAAKTEIEKSPSSYDDKRRLERDLANASLTALLNTSKQSAQRILNVWQHERPSSYDYGERHGPSRAFTPVLSSCLSAWTKGRQVAFHHLLPVQLTTRKNQRIVRNREDALTLLKRAMVTYPNGKKDKKGNLLPQRRFDDRESEKICDGIQRVLEVVQPLQDAVLRGDGLKARDFHHFVFEWKSRIRNVHWNAEEPTDVLTRTVGLGFAGLILQHADSIDMCDAETIVEIVSGDRFTIEDRIRVLNLISQRDKLHELAGKFGLTISAWVCKDEYVEQRGENHQKLTRGLLPLGVTEAREYYKEGLAQLDQMGGDDYDLVYSILRYAEVQSGGLLTPAFSQRLMNLCQIIAYHEPRKFGWTLYSSAAATSIGFPAVYKFLRWADQDVCDFSYGLPELVCFLTKRKQLCAKRATAILTLCEDFGSHNWEIGQGLDDLLHAAQNDDCETIAKVVLSKLQTEHCDGGWDALWGSVIKALEKHEGLVDDADLTKLRMLKTEAYERRHEDNERRNGPSHSYRVEDDDQQRKKEELEAEFQQIVEDCDVCSVSDIDEALHAIRENKGFEHNTKDRFLDALAENCVVENRPGFIDALCEIQNLRFDDIADRIIGHVKAWQKSSAYLSKNKLGIVERLFAFQGSGLFDLRYTGITRQIKKLSEFCGSKEHVVRLAVKSVANEHLVLDGDEWLELASSITSIAAPSTALTALEQLLSSALAKVGDEVGEGAYHSGMAPPTDEAELVVDVFWHLLGNEDAFIRWNCARAIHSLVELGLHKELNGLIDRIGNSSGERLRSESHQHAFWNAEQWLLIGLARATLFEPSKLSQLAPKLERLFHAPSTHILSKVLIARCLNNLWKGTDDESKLLGIWTTVNVPPHGYVENDAWPAHSEPRQKFRFDYDFNKYQISGLARLFGISEGEASDAIAEAIQQKWPDAKNMSYFSGQERYRRRQENRYETFREHVQRHALLNAATQMVSNFPVSRRSYQTHMDLPWPEWISDFDLTFEDGSWLSDRKDHTPKIAHHYLLGPRSGSSDTLCHNEELVQKLALDEPDETGMFPIYGSWRSHDGVSVRVVSALVRRSGAVGVCRAFARLPDHEIWLPTLETDGESRTHQERSEFTPWIWEPERFCSAIDEEDKFATRTAATRAKVGPSIIGSYELSSLDEGKSWHGPLKERLLQSTVWGRWSSGTDGYFQDEGTVLRADRQWLDQVMSDRRQSIAYYIHVEKYNSHRSYDSDDSVKSVVIGLLTEGHDLRIWPARLENKTRY